MIAVSPSVFKGQGDENLGVDPSSDAGQGADPAGQVVEAHVAGGPSRKDSFDIGAAVVERRTERVDRRLQHGDGVHPRVALGAAADRLVRLLARRQQLHLFGGGQLVKCANSPLKNARFAVDN